MEGLGRGLKKSGPKGLLSKYMYGEKSPEHGSLDIKGLGSWIFAG